MAAAAPSSAELLQAHAELWSRGLSYIKTMALVSAVKLGIPTAIHRHGGAASLSELHAALPVPASKRPCLSRLMKLLAATGIFSEGGDGAYRLTPVSRFLVEDDAAAAGGGGYACMSPLLVMGTTMRYVGACLRLPEWLQSEDDAAAAETPFMMANGARLYDVVGRDAEYGPLFNDSMGADSRFLAEIVVRECGEVFAGAASLVDVGGGDGTTAKAIARAFPHVRCSVLELPQLVDSLPADGTVEFVAGDMMEFIPPADIVLFKLVMNNWSDEDCVKILKRSKEAICAREHNKGKVIIIDIVIGSASKEMLEAQLLQDICMMTVTTGKGRDEEKWHKIFLDAGFSRYKISHILGFRSLIEVYP